MTGSTDNTAWLSDLSAKDTTTNPVLLRGMQRPQRDPKKPLLTFPLLMRTGLVTLISLAGAFGLFAWEHGTEGRNLDEARAAVVNVICDGADRLPAELPFPDLLGTFGQPVFQSLDARRHRRDVAGTDPLHLPAVYEPSFS